MTQPTHSTEHTAEAVARLPQYIQENDADGVAALSARMDRWQDLEDALQGLLVERDLPIAVGAQLEQWGVLIGEQREGLSDADYRRFISARLAAQMSRGTPDDVLNVVSLVTQSVRVRLFELQPATSRVEYEVSAPLPATVRSKLIKLVELADPVGVASQLVEASFGYFGWSGDPPALGFGAGAFATRIM